MPKALSAVLIVCGVLIAILFSVSFFYLHAMRQPAGNYTSDISMSSFCNVLTLTGDGRWYQTVQSESATAPNHVSQRKAEGTWARTGPGQLMFSPGLYDDALSPSHVTFVNVNLDINGIAPELSWSAPRTPFSRMNPLIKYHKPLTGNTSCPFFQLH